MFSFRTGTVILRPVSRPRVDVVVPGAEGSWIARALRQAGYDVREADDAKGSADADAVILDRSVPGFEAILTELGAPARIVVGWEPAEPEDRQAWGARAVFTRPVSSHRLLETLAEAIGRPPPPSSARTTLPAPSSRPPEAPPPLREPTISLGEGTPAREPTLNLEVSEVPTSPNTQAADQGSPEPPPSSSSQDLSSAGIHVEFGPRIDALLREADRRVFPNERPLDLRFPGGDEPAQELVPDDLLAEVSMPLDVPDADPLDAFTFVGTPDLVTGGERAEAPPSDAGSTSGRTPRTVDDRPGRSSDPGSASTAVRSGVAREGMLPAAGAIRVLWQAHDEPRPVQLSFQIAGGPALILASHGGRLLSLEGPVHLRAAARLRADQRLRAVPNDEESARALLQDEVRFGRLDAFELSQLLRRARETLIHELVVAPEARFRMEPFTGSAGEHPLVHGRLVAVACEGARQRVRAREALRWLGLAPQEKLVLSSTFGPRALDAGLEPELIEAFEAAADRAVGELLGSTPTVAGVAGALLTLASADAVRTEGTADSMEVRAGVARERILRAARLAREGNYFVILGVDPQASGRAIERARRRATRELLQIDLAFLDLENLEDVRREALVAIEEAAAVLADRRLREAYARALERPPLR